MNMPIIPIVPVEPHVCPYRAEIHEDYETLCTCDRESTNSCAQDI